MNGRTVAVISDVHGNTPALHAVLAEIITRGIDCVFNLGDSLYGPLDPLGTYTTFMTAPLTIIHIMGNGDRILLPGDSGEPGSATVHYTREQLPFGYLDWLGTLPGVFCDADIFACHGSPDCDSSYLLEDMHISGAVLKSPAAVTAGLAGITQPVILCGHSHIPRVCAVPGGQLVVNPGSVGLPAYYDETPVPHRMESGSPHARFSILHKDGSRWQVEQLCVPYAWEPMAALAETQGRADWARAIASGRA